MTDKGSRGVPSNHVAASGPKVLQTIPLNDTVLARGGYVARFEQSDADVRRSQRLRHRCFVTTAGAGARYDGLDTDAFDARCRHVLVENAQGALVCSYRVLHLESGAQTAASYSSQYYDLTQLAAYADPMLELGRFCVDPDVADADVLRIAWGMLAKIVDGCGAGLLFGCSSFAGTDAAAYGGAFDLLAARYQAPAAWRVGVKACEVVRFGTPNAAAVDRKSAMEQVPALLRTYLGMGGWVSDHAVIDRAMNTLHVFTGLEISAIPAARAKALRSV